MNELNPELKISEPKSIFEKSLKADFKELFKSIGKGLVHGFTGKWTEVSSDAVDALSALDLATRPDELAFLLIRRSITSALFELIGESSSLLNVDREIEADSLLDELDNSAAFERVRIPLNFFDSPSDLPIVVELKLYLTKWFEHYGVSKAATQGICNRLPSYFAYALNQEWRKNAKVYQPLLDTLETPFSKATEREWAWRAYSANLERRVQEAIFDEAFGLRQIYVPLNAYYTEDRRGTRQSAQGAPQGDKRKVVVDLERELMEWIDGANADAALRVLSGGPGSGKSSFARIFAANVSSRGRVKVLYIPLHLIDPTQDLIDEVGRFVREGGLLPYNPLESDTDGSNLLVIFDGLDELASQGRAAAETARAFLREVERTLGRRNSQTLKLMVLISGREVIVQGNETDFRKPKQILTLLPYFVQIKSDSTNESEEFHDPEKLLLTDLRDVWWARYGMLTGKGYTSMPDTFKRDDLDEVTSQPLLNYLVALSFNRKTLDFEQSVNLNKVYEDLVMAVHERAWEKRRPHQAIRNLNLDEFFRILEEIALAAWHGDGRSTTVREVEEHARAGGLGPLLDAFKTGAEAGATQLLAAFFFRQHGQRASGDPTFVFTHKSFGEYLAAKRIVRAVDKIVRDLEARESVPGEGCDEREALRKWAELCGPSKASDYIVVFLRFEFQLRSRSDLERYQFRYSKLISTVLAQGMPMELLGSFNFSTEMLRSRNAEETLLLTLSALASQTKNVSTIIHPDRYAFMRWFRRIQDTDTLAVKCLNYLDLAGCNIGGGDFRMADFTGSSLSDVWAQGANFGSASFDFSDLSDAFLGYCIFQGATFFQTRIVNAWLGVADLTHATFYECDMQNSTLIASSLTGSTFSNTNLSNADLESALIDRAEFTHCDLSGADLTGARATTKLTKEQIKRYKKRSAKVLKNVPD